MSPARANQIQDDSYKTVRTTRYLQMVFIVDNIFYINQQRVRANNVLTILQKNGLIFSISLVSTYKILVWL